MQENQRILVQNIFEVLPALRQYHNLDNPLLTLFQKQIESFYKARDSEKMLIAPFEDLIFPTVCLGNINSDIYLYAKEEFVIRAFYARNISRYNTFFDIGANIGWDTLLAASLGWKVDAFEPEPENFTQLMKNIKCNRFSNVCAHCKAISNISGELNFVRVKGNLTASHITGMRTYYGDANFISVSATTFEEIGFYPDLIKMNIEAAEKNVISTIPLLQWEKTDCFVALHDDDNRKAIFEHFIGSNVNLFSQKLGWEKADRIEDLPFEKEGYVFISTKKTMPW